MPPDLQNIFNVLYISIKSASFVHPLFADKILS